MGHPTCSDVSKKIDPTDDGILYHAAQSMPHSTSGYSIRTHGLVTAIRKANWNAQVHLRHGYPLDRTDSMDRANPLDREALKFKF